MGRAGGWGRYCPLPVHCPTVWKRRWSCRGTQARTHARSGRERAVGRVGALLELVADCSGRSEWAEGQNGGGPQRQVSAGRISICGALQANCSTQMGLQGPGQMWARAGWHGAGAPPHGRQVAPAAGSGTATASAACPPSTEEWLEKTCIPLSLSSLTEVSDECFSALLGRHTALLVGPGACGLFCAAAGGAAQCCRHAPRLAAELTNQATHVSVVSRGCGVWKHTRQQPAAGRLSGPADRRRQPATSADAAPRPAPAAQGLRERSGYVHRPVWRAEPQAPQAPMQRWHAGPPRAKPAPGRQPSNPRRTWDRVQEPEHGGSSRHQHHPGLVSPAGPRGALQLHIGLALRGRARARCRQRLQRTAPRHRLRAASCSRPCSPRRHPAAAGHPDVRHRACPAHPAAAAGRRCSRSPPRACAADPSP